MLFVEPSGGAMKALTYLVAGLALIGLAIVLLTANGVLDTNRAEAMARYGGPPSQFIDIDGAILHFRDEGQGPPLVLLHGSRASLHQWDGWVDALKDEFRIIRIDGAGHGLSGSDANDDYSPDRQTSLLEGLLDHLKVERVYLGGTSSGSNQAVRFAAERPTRVEKLVLSTVPLKLPASPSTPWYWRFVFWLHNDVLRSTGTNWYWRSFLKNIFADPAKVTDSMVERYRTLNNLPGRLRDQQLRIDEWYKWGGPDRDFAMAGRVTAPTFVQWGVAGPVLPPEVQCQITAAFENADVRVMAYSDLGHKLVMEDPVRTARDAARYLRDEDVGGACADSESAR